MYIMQEKSHIGWVENSQNQFNSIWERKKQIQWRESQQNVLQLKRDISSEIKEIHELFSRNNFFKTHKNKYCEFRTTISKRRIKAYKISLV